MPGDAATCRLADLGADVIKVEQPPVGDYLRSVPPFVDGTGFYHLTMNRNKRSIGVDLKTDVGRSVFLRLLETADVLIESSRPGAMAALDLDYDTLRRLRPEIVYCSLSGYGQDGPYRHLAAHGMNVDAAAGLMRIRRDETGRPEIAYSSAAGVDAGGMYAALAVTAALCSRLRSTRGRYLDVSCWDAALASSQEFGHQLAGLDGGFRTARERGIGGPRYNVYGTGDGKVLLLCPIEKKFWRHFCSAVDRPEWLERGGWNGETDMGNDDPTLRDDIEALIRTHTLTEWMDLFAEADVPVSPVVDLADLSDDPHVRARRVVVDGEHGQHPGVRYVRPPVRLPGVDYAVVLPAPKLGEHTEAVLAEIGYGSEERAELVDSGAVVVP